MVQISKRSGSKSGLLPSWLSWRTALVLVIAIQGTRLLFKLSNNAVAQVASNKSLQTPPSPHKQQSLPSQKQHPPSKVVHQTRLAAAGKSKASQPDHKQQPKQEQEQRRQHENEGEDMHPDVRPEEHVATDDESHHIQPNKAESVVHASHKQQQQMQNPPKKGTSSSNSNNNVLTKHGTGPASTGYVVDLVQEREQASFRTSQTAETSNVEVVTQLLQSTRTSSSKTLRACQYVNPAGVLYESAHCRLLPKDEVLYVYNSAPFARYYPCPSSSPILIEAHQAVALPPNCHATNNHKSPLITYIFPQPLPDTTSAKNVPAVTFLSKATAATTTTTSLDHIGTRTIPNCPAVPKCSFEDSLVLAPSSGSNVANNEPNDKDHKAARGVTRMAVYGTNWTVWHSTDDPYYNPNAKIERTNYRRDLYYSTLSQTSSVPLSFFNVKDVPEYAKHIVDWSTAANKVAYLLNDECTTGRRHKWVAAVAAQMEMDSYGSCDRTTALSTGETIDTLEGRLALMRKNRITLALEEGTDKDYITNIVWEALLAGNVPAIMGATNLDQRLPPNAAILSSAFNSWDKFAAHIALVARNQTLYESYQAWRKDPAAIATFAATWAYTNASPECRLCTWALAKQYGYGWNHSRQVIQSPHIERKLCHDASHVTHPFVEQWMTMTSAHGDDTATTSRQRKLGTEKACSSSQSPLYGTVQVKASSNNGQQYTVERTIVEHDGVIDIVITKLDSKGGGDGATTDDLVLRLEFNTVRNTEGAYFRDTHTLVTESRHIPTISSASMQDDAVKVTVLANWATRIHSPAQGLLDVTIAATPDDNHDEHATTDGARYRRIRVITEDMNVLHDKMTEFFPSTFGRHMMHDFMDPLELYYDA